MTYRSGGPPHAYPKGLHGCYRGRLVRNPRLIERAERAPMATARIAVRMAAPNTPREDRDALTEFVNVLAFDERCRHLLMNGSTGQLVAIVGGVTLETYTGRDGKKNRSHRDEPDAVQPRARNERRPRARTQVNRSTSATGPRRQRRRPLLLAVDDEPDPHRSLAARRPRGRRDLEAGEPEWRAGTDVRTEHPSAGSTRTRHTDTTSFTKERLMESQTGRRSPPGSGGG